MIYVYVHTHANMYRYDRECVEERKRHRETEKA